MKEIMFRENIEAPATPHLVITGGGTGTSVMAKGLAEAFPDSRISVVAAQSDDGGSTGELRQLISDLDGTDDFPAVGDFRKITAAFSPNQSAAALSERRFSSEDTAETVSRAADAMLAAVTQGDKAVDPLWAAMQLDDAEALAAELPGVDGHPLGNLVLAAMTRNHQDITKATALYGQLLQLNPNHKVIPVTSTPHQLNMTDGQCIVRGQNQIDHHIVANPKEAQVWIDPVASIHPDARAAIEDADAIISGPGSLYGSQLAVYAVHGVRDAMQNMKETSSFVSVANLVEQEGTAGMDVGDYAAKLGEYAGRKVDYIIYNNAPDILPRSSKPVAYDPDHISGDQVAIGAPLAMENFVATYDPNDKIKDGRSEVKTRPEIVAEVMRSQILSHTDESVQRAA